MSPPELPAHLEGVKLVGGLGPVHVDVLDACRARSLLNGVGERLERLSRDRKSVV